MRGWWHGDGDDRGAAQLTAELEAVDSAGLAALLAGEPRLVLVEFASEGCEPCRQLRPELEALAESGAGVCRVVTVDVDREPEAAHLHGVRATPTLAFFRQGQELGRFRGGALPASVRRLLASPRPPASPGGG